jgi:hypothetical protein
MNYEQKKLVVRVYLPGPPERVTDWEAVAKRFELCLHNLDRQYDDYIEGVIRDNTTERPSRIDTGVDVVINNSKNTGAVRVSFVTCDYTSMSLLREVHLDQIAALTELEEENATLRKQIDSLEQALEEACEISGIHLASDGESVADGMESDAFWHCKPTLAAWLRKRGYTG